MFFSKEYLFCVVIVLVDMKLFGVFLGFLLAGVVSFSVGQDLPSQAEELIAEEEIVDRKRDLVEPVITEIAEGRYQIGEFVEIDSQQKTIAIKVQVEFDGRTRQDGVPAKTEVEGQVLIEYILANLENGPTHEALCVTHAAATDLQLALLLLAYEPYSDILALQTVDARGNPVFRDPIEQALSAPFFAGVAPAESQLKIELIWEEEEDRQQILVQDALLRLNREEGEEKLYYPFVFTGSHHFRGYFVAESSGTLISNFLVDAAIINPGTEEAVRDDIWVPNPEVLPARGTQATLLLSPFVEEGE